MKYLLEIHHGIGDVVQYTGLIKSVRDYDNRSYIGVVLNKNAYAKLFAFDKNVDEVHIIDFSGNKLELCRNIVKIRKRHYDYMICSVHSKQCSMEFMAVAFGAKKVVGSKLGRLHKVSKRFQTVNVNGKELAVKQNNDVLLGLNPRFKIFNPYIVCPPLPVDIQKNSVGLCIGTSMPQKTWPIENFICIGEFLESLGYHIVLIGGKKEQEIYYKNGYKNSRWLNLLGKTDLLESAVACAKCELLIGGDTGIMHIAAAVGTKTLTLFTCSPPMVSIPYSTQSYYYYVSVPCQFCVLTKTMEKCRNWRCVYGIRIDKVKEIVEGILKEPDKVEKYRWRLDIPDIDEIPGGV